MVVGVISPSVDRIQSIALRPLHTQAKSRVHEIMRAHKKVSKDHQPKTPPKSCSFWSRVLKGSAKSYVTGPSTRCYFDEFLFIPDPYTR
jgi:hypothetical protein